MKSCPCNLPSHDSGDRMEKQNSASCDIRAAHCFIEDRDAFLQTIQTIARQYDTHIICFNTDMMAGKIHAEAAVLQAARSFTEGTAISNTMEMEALLYAAGSRQCTIAASFGVQTGVTHIYVCCYPRQEEVWMALEPFLQVIGNEERDVLLDAQTQVRLMLLFDIPACETETQDRNRIVDLVLERVALLNVYR